MQSARYCIVMFLLHGLAQRNLHAGDARKGCGDGWIALRRQHSRISMQMTQNSSLSYFDQLMLIERFE